MKRFTIVCSVLIACVSAGSAFGQRKLVIILDRTGSMNVLRNDPDPPKNTRCVDAYNTADGDLNFFFDNLPVGVTGEAAIVAFAGASGFLLNTGFLNRTDAQNALDSIAPDDCPGVSTNLADVICDGINLFPPGGEVASRILAISSDGLENDSSGKCAGTDDPVFPFDDKTSWQGKIVNQIADAGFPLIINIRLWTALAATTAGTQLDVETGRPHATGPPTEFLQFLADLTGGTFILQDDSAPIIPNPPVFRIPTVSQWGIGIMALMLLIGGKVYFSRRRAVQA